MLDDTTMDKKNMGRPSATYKGSSSDTKVKPDVPPKQQGRPSWKRGNGRQQDAPRKPNPQRSRCVYDKRPMPRGASLHTEDTRSEVARSLQDESVDTVKRGSKKVNLNHLLNFTLAPRENAESHHYYRASYDSRGGLRSRGRLPKYNKEQFLQANCQFVVRDGGSYAQHCSDADTLVDWDLVEEVRTGAFEDPTCPICLYPPVAAKMTRCGHVYCWPCLLHYLSLTDHSWRRCPICYEAIHRNEFKSAVTEAKTLYGRGDKITMCLMRREKGCMFPAPQQLWRKGIAAPLNLSDDKSKTCYQKLLTADVGQIEAILNREERQLQEQLVADGETPEACFVEAALQALDERRRSLCNFVAANNLANDFATLATSDPGTQPPLLQTLTPAGEEKLDQEKNVITGPQECDPARNRERCISTGSSDVPLDFTISAEDLEFVEPESAPLGTGNGNQDPKDSYYFYQSADGQAIFLHALNVKMLVREYGSLEQCPPLFEAEIVDIEGASIDMNLRQRLRYLRHVPLTCEIKVVELKLETPLVTADTLQHFKGDVERRRRLRSRRAREEKKRDRFLAQEELKRRGCYPAARFNLNSPYQFPSHNGSPPDGAAAVLPESQANVVSSSSSDLDDRHSLGSAPGNSADDDVGEGPSPKVSFAQMLQCKTMSSGSANVSWARKVPTPAPSRELIERHPDSECEDHVPVPSFHQSFSLALQDAFDNMEKCSSTAAETLAGGRKKKKNKTLLFSTFMNRSK